MDPLFAGSGLGSLHPVYEDLDWAGTSLGAVEGWSSALRSSVALMMNTRFAITLFWGPDFTMVYNEPYAAMIGDKHPAALGTPAHAVFPEIWDVIGPMLAGVRDGGDAIWARDEKLFLDRHGFAEETFFTFSYSRIAAEDGRVEGLIDIATETTREVIDRRRLAALALLGTSLLEADDEECVLRLATKTLIDAKDDVTSVRFAGRSLPAAWTDLDRVSVADTAALSRQVAIERSDDGSVLATVRLDGSSTASRGAVLTLGLSPHRPVDESYENFVQLAGTAITQALDRVGAHRAERHDADLDRQMAEALQRSLLGAPIQAAGLHIAARYEATAERAQIGGDWYDSFALPGGVHAVVVGDVTGHDREAAATMAHVRNLLRGVAYGGPRSPAQLLTTLDGAIQALGFGALATGVVLQVEPDVGDRGERVARWTNAGHLPPVIVDPAGHATLLASRPNLLLGLKPDTGRDDHEVVLEQGSTVVLYTDGLIERRDADFEDSLRELTDELEGTQALDPDRICDRLLARFGHDTDDDVVLLVLRVA